MAGTWTCSEDEDFGSIGDLKVILTGGTSGTPATFADFVTADRAGEAVLLAATAGLSGPANTLDEAVRPVEDLAIVVSCIVASKTTEADYIYITGTDFAGNAQTESIDVSTGNGTYTTTKAFATITSLDCSDASTGGGTAWADGTIRVTQARWGLIWDYGNGQYLLKCNEWDVGDNSTVTYFSSTLEMVHLDMDKPPRVRHNATQVLGAVHEGWGIDGSYWCLDVDTVNQFWQDWTASSLQIYASMVNLKSDTLVRHRFGTTGDGLIIRNSIISGRHAGYYNYFDYNTGYMDLQDTYMHTMEVGWRSAEPPTNVTMDNIHLHNLDRYGLASNDNGAGAPQISNVRITDADNADVNTEAAGSSIDVIDPLSEPTTLINNQATNEVRLKYTVNIHVVDKDGANINGATVVLDYSASSDYDTEAFSTTTAADGTITEQTVLKKKWVGTSETLTDYEPWRFTISNTGYETLIIEEVNPSAPINYRFELQASKQPPAPWQEGLM